jgi:hypothetical protein
MQAATSGWVAADRCWGAHAARASIDLFAQIADAIAQHSGALRRFALPERNAGRRAVRVFDQHPARADFDTLDAPAGVAEQDHVAGRGVDGEVLIERGDLHVSGCSITAKSAVSGIAPPLEMAIMRAPRRACRWPCTRSRSR